MPIKDSDPEPLQTAWSLYRDRAKEVGKYLAFIETIDLNSADGLSMRGETLQNFTIERDLIKTLRATGYLMIYNMVEATMTSAIDAIHRHIQDDNIEFDKLTNNIQSIVLGNFSKKVKDWPSVNLENHPIGLALSRLGYERDKLFSGNVDARSIKEVAERYGFTIPPHNRKRTRDGVRMLDVKTKRNDLAHGVISFETCGHEISSTDLRNIFRETMVFLLVTLRGIRQYIISRGYARELASA